LKFQIIFNKINKHKSRYSKKSKIKFVKAKFIVQLFLVCK